MIYTFVQVARGIIQKIVKLWEFLSTMEQIITTKTKFKNQKLKKSNKKPFDHFHYTSFTLIRLEAPRLLPLADEPIAPPPDLVNPSA